MKIFVGADHGGFELKAHLSIFLQEHGYEVKDMGADEVIPTDDYPEFAFSVAEAVVAAQQQQAGSAFGIVLCRSGAGMVIAANKVLGVRAALVASPKEAQHAREHNNANIIGFAADWIDQEMAQASLLVFLETAFDPGSRHARRVEQIIRYEQLSRGSSTTI